VTTVQIAGEAHRTALSMQVEAYRRESGG